MLLSVFRWAVLKRLEVYNMYYLSECEYDSFRYLNPLIFQNDTHTELNKCPVTCIKNACSDLFSCFQNWSFNFGGPNAILIAYWTQFERTMNAVWMISNDSHPLSTTETEKKHRPYMPSWHGEGLTLTNFINETCVLALN